ncbi:MAG: LPS export ABC transporter permease LptF [Wenzhouxiangellaceae bacterium]|jgi:lipopolysaccharide export system permease protein|nr:LPS export ABC transporter permease LptF [Wenzhouxiangellaceae bacterium]MBS3745837.1 LPS export ABC transporter permease LptF [Wenzhouxiangellaceae bacterium]MBS3824260.1 LPS export ABC transporter permease LptF [Wenzhouxiangellaceae bacterium]
MQRSFRLDAYIRRQALGVCMMTLAILMAISLALFLAELLGDLADGEVLVSTLVELLLLRLPEAILLVAPLALVVGLLMSLGEMAQGEEFSVMRSAGLAPRRLLQVVLGLALAWAVGLLVVAGWVAPWAEQRSAAIAERMAEDLLLASVRPGQFQTLAGGRLTVYVREADLEAGELEGVFVHFSRQGEVEAVAAARGRLHTRPESGERVLSLHDGVHIGHAETGSGLPMRRIEFERNDIQLPLGSRGEADDPERRRYLPALLSDASAPAGAEFQRRLVPPVVSLVLALFALPITLAGARGKRFGVVLIAVAVYLVYTNTANLLLLRSGLGYWPGVWPLHAAALVLALLATAAWWRRW